jgi:hypothetical protein
MTDSPSPRLTRPQDPLQMANRQLAEACSRLANNQDLKLVLTTLKKSYIDQIVASPPDATAKREQLYFAHNAVEAVGNWITAYAARNTDR